MLCLSENVLDIEMHYIAYPVLYFTLMSTMLGLLLGLSVSGTAYTLWYNIVLHFASDIYYHSLSYRIYGGGCRIMNLES